MTAINMRPPSFPPTTSRREKRCGRKTSQQSLLSFGNQHRAAAGQQNQEREHDQNTGHSLFETRRNIQSLTRWRYIELPATRQVIQGKQIGSSQFSVVADICNDYIGKRRVQATLYSYQLELASECRCRGLEHDLDLLSGNYPIGEV